MRVLENTSQPEIAGTRTLPTLRVIEENYTRFSCDKSELKSSQTDQL